MAVLSRAMWYTSAVQSVSVPCKQLTFRKFLGDWLGDLDSNQGCTGQSREFYR